MLLVLAKTRHTNKLRHGPIRTVPLSTEGSSIHKGGHWVQTQASQVGEKSINTGALPEKGRGGGRGWGGNTPLIGLGKRGDASEYPVHTYRAHWDQPLLEAIAPGP